jgi:alcohol dehydrogenase
MAEMVLPFRTPPLAYVGVGALAKLGPEVQRLGARRALLVTDRGVAGAGIAERVRLALAAAGVEAVVFDQTKAEPDFENVDQCLDVARGADVGLIVGVGGGSSMDLAKAIAAMLTNEGKLIDYYGADKLPTPALPIIAIPTTSGTGSEATPNAIFTDHVEKLKKGIVSPYLMPRVAIVDPELTLTTPPRVTAATGMDALTHAVESFISRKATPQSEVYSLDAIRRIGGSLRTAVFDGANLAARTEMALSSYFAGIAIANAGTAAVHAMAYPLGGQFGVAHGVSNALLMPYVLDVTQLGCLKKMAVVGEALGEPVDGLSAREAAQAAVDAIRTLAADVGIPRRMREVGVPRAAVPGMATAASEIRRLMDNNPRQLSRDEVQAVYEEAW